MILGKMTSLEPMFSLHKVHVRRGLHWYVVLPLHTHSMSVLEVRFLYFFLHSFLSYWQVCQGRVLLGTLRILYF